MKKKLKDTKVVKFIQKNAIDIVKVIGYVLPSKGVLGIIKNIIKK